MEPAPVGVVAVIGKVPAASLSEAGSEAGRCGPYRTEIVALHIQSRLLSSGKPLVDYTGSNWCSYCAATRWPLAVALARFGTFKELKLTSTGRGASEPYPGTATLSFYRATYTSRYLAFLTTEQCASVVSPKLSSPSVVDCDGYEPLENMPGIAARTLLDLRLRALPDSL